MSMTDPIADLITRIRNAHQAKHDRLDVPSSRLKVEVCKILREEGFIRNFRLLEAEPARMLRILLRYTREGEPAIRHFARLSRPGRRIYRGADDLRPVRNGLGLAIVSTSRGLLTDRKAREERLGGELLCELW
jgi:small subunit ribosomal protein S8